MTRTPEAVAARLLRHLRTVQDRLGVQVTDDLSEGLRFADALDSMGMIEFVALVAEDCGVQPATIEQSVDRRFTSVGALATSLLAKGLVPGDPMRTDVSALGEATVGDNLSVPVLAWLGATAVQLPRSIQDAASVNALLERPPGWLERHAGIEQRRVWADQEPLTAAAEAGRECLELAGVTVADVGALLVTSEAPPLLVGQAAALHHRLGLHAGTPALEIGGACTGFVAALWLAQSLVARTGVVLMLAVEAASRYLQLRPGPAGEASALFGDAAAAAVIAAGPTGDAVPINDVVLHTDGAAGGVLRAERSGIGTVELRMRGIELAGRAIEAMASSVAELAERQGLAVLDLVGVAAHGGNGRMPALLARQLGLPVERVWSETARTGNLGSASLPTAWTAHKPLPAGPVAWAAVGAGISWGGALLGLRGTGVQRAAAD
jgi:3-oxoacyl-[acyl-carrier-protein] synthase-3